MKLPDVKLNPPTLWYVWYVKSIYGKILTDFYVWYICMAVLKSICDPLCKVLFYLRIRLVYVKSVTFNNELY